MRVYIARGWFDWGGYSILGVYDSKEKAIAKCDTDGESFDYTDVLEKEVE